MAGIIGACSAKDALASHCAVQYAIRRAVSSLDRCLVDAHSARGADRVVYVVAAAAAILLI
jgi:hypothetical protein